jgi:hypothetical protein
MVSRDPCAPVKCSGGAAILTIQWFDGTNVMLERFTETMRAASEASWGHYTKVL